MSSGSPPTADRPPVFVTGGTGFVGSHLVEALQARGHREVRCLVRSSPGWLESIGHTPVRGDLTDPEVLGRAMKGCATVFHVAGRTRAREWKDFEAANITGTLTLLEAARALADPPRVQIVSSLAAVGNADAAIADEQTPLDPVSMYGSSKARMEAAVEPYRRDLDITVVRPPAVYGPRDSDIYTVFQAASRGLFAVVGDVSGPAMSLVHVRDLVAGMIAASETQHTSGETYFLGADPPYSWAQVRDAAARALGRRVFTLRIPSWLIVPVGSTVETIGGLFGAYPPLNREKALEIRDACIMCSSGKAFRDFGYSPSTPLQQGFDETVAWYRSNGWL